MVLYTGAALREPSESSAESISAHGLPYCKPSAIHDVDAWLEDFGELAPAPSLDYLGLRHCSTPFSLARGWFVF